MSLWKNILNNLPEVEGPSQKNLSFKEKLKWTMVVLTIFFLMGMLPLFGLGLNALARFEQLSIILGAEFGSIISLGIGPIVTASIVLQLLNGSGLVKFNLQSPDGKRTFQGTQKVLAFAFIVFESIVFVQIGGLAPDPALQGLPVYNQLEALLTFQLILGGIVVLFLDEVVSKWGFGSGISLFIAAGVSKSLFLQAFNWLEGANSFATGSGYVYSAGAVPAFFQSLANNDPTTATLMIAAIISTIAVFCIAVYASAMKVEIPLSFGRVRGHGIRWPLSFIYTSVIPVILISALIANFQIWGNLLDGWGYPILGEFDEQGQARSGIVYWLQGPRLIPTMIQQQTIAIGWEIYLQALSYMAFLMIGSMVFSLFWMQTAGMDAKSQAKQMMSSGLQIPGFRKDGRVLERILHRYIMPLTIMGGLTVGFLSAVADLLGSLGQGTALLLTVMIIYKLYEEIAKQHMMDMNPLMRKFMG